MTASVGRASSSLLIVTHGGPGIGGGHISRCLALASALGEFGYSVSFAVNSGGRGLLGARAEEVFVSDKLFSSDPAGLSGVVDGCDFAVVDSYEASPEWLAALASCCSLVVIDDLADRPVGPFSSVLLNHNLGADSLRYDLAPSSLALLGPDYALLRPEVSCWSRRLGEGGVLLEEAVFFVAGASDVGGVTERVLGWWQPRWPHLKAVVGPLTDEESRSRCRGRAGGKPNVTLLEAPENFLEEMARSERVICTSSVTAYEALALRKPLAVFQVASNQEGIGAAIEELHLGRNLGRFGSFGADEVEAFLDLAPLVPPAVVNPEGAKAAASALAAFFERGER